MVCVSLSTQQSAGAPTQKVAGLPNVACSSPQLQLNRHSPSGEFAPAARSLVRAFHARTGRPGGHPGADQAASISLQTQAPTYAGPDQGWPSRRHAAGGTAGRRQRTVAGRGPPRSAHGCAYATVPSLDPKHGHGCPIALAARRLVARAGGGAQGDGDQHHHRDGRSPADVSTKGLPPGCRKRLPATLLPARRR